MKILERVANEKVEWKRLEEVCEFKRGRPITKKSIKEGNIPVIAGGQKPAYYHNESNRMGESIVVAGSGAYAGYVSYWNEPIFVSDAFTVEPNEKLLEKYLYYFLINKQNQIYELKQGAGIPHVYGASLSNIQIPIPSLELQEEIVEILDKFSYAKDELVKELGKECDLREKQYSYYRDMLLSLEYLKKISNKFYPNGDFEIKEVKVKDVFKRVKGTPITAKIMKEIEDEKGDIKVFAGGKTQIMTFEKDIPNANIIDVPAVIVQSRGLIDVIYYEDKFTFKNEMWAYVHQNKETLKYLFYYFKNNIEKFIEMASGKGSLPQISLTATEDFKILLPPLEVQKHVVDILDKFYTISNNLKEGLPYEIYLRQKQYEYYREKLLDFKK